VGNILLPVLAAGGHVWVHGRCWEDWQTARRGQAIAAIRELLPRRLGPTAQA
jgi:hypothetical protein